IVILQCIIDRSGTIRDVQVLLSPHPLLSVSAEEAVRQWKFRPGTLGGQPVDVIFNLTVRFEMQ
ncbi:MAG TPA: energy transducer TonB, partial [Thermoanaerobaculia bacterium]|nr:energy transducer TonB [Thermoanaerobaculia bacterium]